jgi:hypothetical protein
MARTIGAVKTGVNRNNSMLVTISISQHGKSKKDKTATINTEDTFQVESGMTSATKQLFKSGDLQEIEAQIGIIRKFHMTNTLPWTEASNSRLLPSAKYHDYSIKLRELIEELDKIVYKKSQELTTLIDNAKHSLGQLFDPTNYSTPEKFRDSFKVKFSPTPLPSADDFRVTDNISADDIAQIKADIEQEVEDRYKAALKDPWERIYNRLNGLLDSLKSKDKGGFQDVSIEHILDLCDTLPALNIGNDENLNKMAKVIAARIGALDTKAVRTDKEERKDAIDTLETIMEKMSGFMSF